MLFLFTSAKFKFNEINSIKNLLYQIGIEIIHVLKDVAPSHACHHSAEHRIKPVIPIVIENSYHGGLEF